MLSRKYYKQFADILKKATEEQYLENAVITGTIENHKELGIINGITENLIEFFRSDNPRFDEDTFRQAMEINFKDLKKQLEVEC